MRLLRRAVLASVAIAGCMMAASCSYVSAAAVLPQTGLSLPAVPSVSVPSIVSNLGAGWKQTFRATFTGSKLDTSVWGTCYPWQSPSGCTNFGNSDEYEWYTPAQDQVYGGALHLIPMQEPTQGKTENGARKEYAYRSGMVTTYPSFNYKYGYLQVVARIPSGPGLWPALWLLPENEQWPPEIDILESYGASPAFQHLHSTNYPVQMASEPMQGLTDGWHVFGLYWTASVVTCYVDGQKVFSTTHGVPHLPMYFLADLAVYQQGQPGWNPITDSLDIQSVQVWQARSYPQQGHSLLP